MIIKKNILKKSGSAFIAAIITILSIGNVVAIDTSDMNEQIFNDENSNIQLLTKDEIPDAVNYEDALEKGHCERVFEKEEDLNSFVFENTDGTQSQYIFNYPVKYIDESGTVQDKSMELEEDVSSDSFTSSSSDILTTFNKRISDGIELEYEDINIKMIPDFTYDKSVGADLSEDQKNISYTCSDDISLEYSLTYQGIKENIILDEYNGINEFSFTLLTNGLKLNTDENGQFNLYNENNDIVANIGEIIVYDSIENTTIGNLSFKEISNNQKYQIIISVDEEYLSNENIVYPVYIDPTIEVNYINYGSTLYNGEPAIAHSTIFSDGKISNNETMTVGKYGSKKARTLMNFPALFNNIYYGFGEMDKSQIQSVKVYLRDVGYQADINAMNVSCYEYCNHWKDGWTNNGDTYTSDNNLQPLSVQNICHSNGIQQNPVHTYAFDITSLAKNWNYTASSHYWKYGIMFKADDTIENGNVSKYCSFGSYNSVYYAPYLVIDYNTQYGYEYAENSPITYTYRTQLNLNAGETYTFQTEKSTNYANFDTELYLFKSDITEELNSSNYTWFNDDISSFNRYSKIEVEIPVSGSYILMAKCYDSAGKNGQCTKGYCNVYKIDPVTQSKTLLKENAQLGGYRLALKENSYILNSSIYNSFTISSNNLDTVMFILREGSSNDKKVMGYNDDYAGNGDYNWGRFSRVSQNYTNESKPRYILVTSYSASASGNVDIYGMCKDTYSVDSMFPNLKQDDAIISAPLTRAYNCIAYSGGITNEWINPDFKLVGGNLSPWYDENNQVAFDNFYGNNPPRYVGATTYSVTENEVDAVINVYKNGNSWTHASVRKPANDQMHGYAWESKLGANVRIFHPADALNYDNPDTIFAYGHVERRYKIADENFNVDNVVYSTPRLSESNEITFEKSVELGLTDIQNIEITDEEKSILSSKVGKIKNDVITQFDAMYSNWTNKILRQHRTIASKD